MLVKIVTIVSILLICFVLIIVSYRKLTEPVEITENEVQEYVDELTLCAWAPWWDYTNSIGEYEKHQKLFNSISPFIYSINENGEIISHFNEELDNFNFSDEVEVIPSISNEFDGERVSVIINDTEKLDRHVNDIVNLVVENNYDGFELDYEYLRAEDRDKYSLLVKKLAGELSKQDKKLVITLHPKTNKKGTWHAAEAQDWKELAKYADELRVMVYDYSWKDSEPGPVSPLGWFGDVVSYALKQIPENKLTIGIGLYGYDWQEGGGTTDHTLGSINTMLARNNIVAETDNKSKTPYFTYIEEGNLHEVWYENEESVSQKLGLLSKMGVKSVCVWRLGSTPNSVIKLFTNE